MRQETRERIESFEEISDQYHALQPLQPDPREEIGYRTELPGLKPETDFSSPDIGEAFIEDKLLVLREKILNIQRHIQTSSVMQSESLEEIETELNGERTRLDIIKNWQLGWKTSVDNRKRNLETRIQDLQKRRRDTEEHFEDKLFRLRQEILDLMPEYLSLKRIRGVLNE
jgi:hypothetical protein